MIKKILVILFFLSSFFAINVYAIDFSGTYQGIKCARPGCVDGKTGTGLIKNLKFFAEFKTEDRIILHVDHDQKNKGLTIFFPDWDYMFLDMPLVGDTFKGNDDKSGNTQINGNVIGDTIRLTLKRHAGQNNEQVYYYKGSLSENDKLLREKIKILLEKESNIASLKKDKKGLQSDIKNLKNDVASKIKEINKLNNEIKTLQKQLKQTIIQKDEENTELKELLENEIANLKKQSKDKITNLTKQSDSKIANLIKQSNDEITKLKIQFEKEKNDLLTIIEKEMSEPIRIDSAFLPMRSETNQETTLHTAPSEKSSTVETLKIATIIENLAVIEPGRDWSLIVTKSGLVGYILTDHIRGLGGSEPEIPPPPGGEKIVITHPKWADGQKNKVITVKAPGFISIKGKINVKAGILQLQLNNNPVEDINNGEFEAFYIVKAGDNEININVIDLNNESHELSFIIRVPK